MRLSTKFMVVATGLLVMSPISYSDGNDLLRNCGSVEHFLNTNKMPDNAADALAFGNCASLIFGVQTTLELYNMNPQKSPLPVCFPEGGADTVEGIQIVSLYLRNNPANLHEHEGLLAIKAFLDAYPCK